MSETLTIIESGLQAPFPTLVGQPGVGGLNRIGMTWAGCVVAPGTAPAGPAPPPGACLAGEQDTLEG
jgi:hypothetical protein